MLRIPFSTNCFAATPVGLRQLRREQSQAPPGRGPGGPAERRPATPPAGGDSDDSEDDDDDDEGGDGLAGLLDWRAKGTAAR